MAGMDARTHAELESLAFTRQAALDTIADAQEQIRRLTQEKLVAAIRRAHDGGASDQSIADVLKMSRNAVNQLRLTGKVV